MIIKGWNPHRYNGAELNRIRDAVENLQRTDVDDEEDLMKGMIRTAYPSVECMNQ